MLVWRNRLSLPLDRLARRARSRRVGAALSRRRRGCAAGSWISPAIHGVPTAARRRRGRSRLARRGRGGGGRPARRLPQGARGGVRDARARPGGCAEDGTSRGARARRSRPSPTTSRVYADPRNAARAAFLTASAGPVPLEPLPRHRAGAAEQEQLEESSPGRCSHAGVESYAVDVTTPDIAELGLRVVRAVAPELCMLDVRQDACFLGGPRLRRAPGRPPAPRASRSPSTSSTSTRTRSRERAREPARASRRPSIGASRPRDDPAELYHEASKLTPATAAHVSPAPRALAASRPLRRAVAARRCGIRSCRCSRCRGARRSTPRSGTAIDDAPLGARRSEPRPIERPALAALLRRATASPASCPTAATGCSRSARRRRAARSIRSTSIVAARARRSASPPGSTGTSRSAAGSKRSGRVPRLVEATANPSSPADAAVTVVFAATFWRSRFKYGQRAYRFALLEAGHAAQNLLLAGDGARPCRRAARRVLRPPAGRRARARRGRPLVALRRVRRRRRPGAS